MPLHGMHVTFCMENRGAGKQARRIGFDAAGLFALS
jgi:hypothetical protein